MGYGEDDQSWVICFSEVALSMAHLLELPQRMQFDQQLWMRVTVFENVYKLFGTVGAVFEITAI